MFINKAKIEPIAVSNYNLYFVVVWGVFGDLQYCELKILLF